MKKSNIRIYLCDDNAMFVEKAHRAIKDIIERDGRVCEMETFTDGNALIMRWNQEFADVVFLDIHMPKMDGFEVTSLIQESRNDVFIVYISSDESKALQAYDYHPYHYIKKDRLDDLNTVIPKLLEKIDVEEEKKGLTFNLRAENCMIELNINTLIYIESLKNYIVVHDRINREKIIRCKLSDAERQLYPFNIIRIQKSYLVNCRFISKVSSTGVFLTNGETLPISRKLVDSVKKENHKYIRRTNL